MSAFEQAWQFLKADVTLPGSKSGLPGTVKGRQYARQNAKAKLGIRNDAPVVFPPYSYEDGKGERVFDEARQFYINDLSRTLANNDFRNALIDVGAYGPEQRRPDTMHPSNQYTHYMYPHFGDIYGKDRKDGGFRQGLGIALDPGYVNNYGTLGQSPVSEFEEARLRELL